MRSSPFRVTGLKRGVAGLKVRSAALTLTAVRFWSRRSWIASLFLWAISGAR
jgi:hypothetical protein